MHLRSITLIFFFLATQAVQGQEIEARKYSNEFLRIGVGARALGMGSAQVATANDVTAGYWNPAGLAATDALPRPEIGLMHAFYFANLGAYTYAGFSMPVDEEGNRRFGVTLLRLGVDDIPNTFDLIDENGAINYNRITTFSVNDFAAILSYAWRPKFTKGLSFGTNFKVIYRGVGRFANAWGFGLDVGVNYVHERLRLGLAITDVTTTYNAWTFNTETFEQAFLNTGNEIPQNSVELTLPSARFGFAYDLRLARRVNLMLALDADMYFDGQRASLISGNTVSLDPRVGAELAILNKDYQPIIFLRGGVYNLQNDRNLLGEEAVSMFPTAGAGVVIDNFQIDYALANIGNLSQNLHSHVLSLKFNFNM